MRSLDGWPEIVDELNGCFGLPLKFRLLGPVEVTINGEPVPISASRQQIALVLLLLEPGRVVSVDRIIDALWGSRPPRTARSQVQITISALRRMLGERVIVTQPPGYLIQVPPESIDLACFAKLTTRGASAAAEERFPEAVRDLRAALALWCGSALEGVQSEAIRGVATRLNEWRVSTYQDCLELELQLGRHREIVGDLTELVAAHPLNERFLGQLMLALYRSGRQADALQTFRAGREVFQEELGLDPPPELRRLEHAMLTRDPEIDLRRPRRSAQLPNLPGATGKDADMPVPRQLPRTITDFTGREDILAEMSLVASGQDGSGQPLEVPVMLLVGRGGVGKTALAVHAAHLLSSEFPDGQLFLQLRPDMPESSAVHMEHLLRSLGVHPSIIPPDMVGRVTLYRSLLAGLRVLVVIDGVRRKSDIALYLPGTGGCAAIVTCSNDITELEGVRRFHVGPLDDQSASRLLATLIGARRMSAERDDARELIRLCEGIPLALRVVAAKLNVRPHWSISHMVELLGDEARRLDELDFEGTSVRATIAAAYESLDEPAQRLLRRLSLVGTADFGSWVGAPLLDADIGEVENWLQQLVALHLIEATEAEDKVVRFRLHDLVRIYAMERCTEGESTANRLDAVRRLLSCLLFLATTARRRIYGGDLAALHGTAEHWSLPEQSIQDLQDPVEWFSIERSSLVAAIFQAAQIGMDELCWDLAVTVATVFESGLCGDADWRESHTCALSIVRDVGNKRGEAALLYALGALETNVRVAKASSCFEQSMAIFDEIGDKQGRALAISGLALIEALKGDYDGAVERYGQAIAGFREIGDRASEAYALKSMAQISASRLGYNAAQNMLDDALSIAHELNAPRLTAQIECVLAELHLRRGQAAAAVGVLSSALRLTSEARDIVGQAFVLASAGDAKRILGDCEGAESALRAALDLAMRAGNRLAWGRSLLGLAELHLARGEEHAALARVDEASAVLRELGAGGVWQARTLELVGRIHERADRLSIAIDMWKAAAELIGSTDFALGGQIARSLARVQAATQE